MKPRIILVAHKDDHDWYITSNQQRQMFIQNLNRIVSKPNVMPEQIAYCTTDSIKKVKVKSSMARSLSVENLLPQNVGLIINYLR